MSFLFGFLMNDAFQFFTSIGLPLLTIMMFLLLVFSFEILNIYFKILIFIYIIFVIFISPKSFTNTNIYSHDYLMKTKSVFIHLNPKGVYMMTKSDYIININHCNPLNGVMDEHLCIWNRDANTLPISVFDIPKDSKNVYRNTVKLSSFYKFVEKQKLNYQFKSIEISQIDFIDYYNIDYLITTKDVIINSLLKSRIKTIIVDENTKERFILLNHK